MAHSIIQQPDPKFDLLFERGVDAPRELVWKAWTTVQRKPAGKQWPALSPVGCLVDRQELGNKQSLRDACGQRLGFWPT
jgi:hypothetical protein